MKFGDPYYFVSSGTKPYEVEHIWADKFDEHRNEFEQQHEFDNYRNRIGDLVLLPQGTNQSYGAMTYGEKVEHYLKENLLVKSLHPKAYENNPNFVGMANNLGLKFKAHKAFTKADINDRQTLIQNICEAIWGKYRTFLDHSLCIAEETPHGRHLVFPSQYRREKDIPHEPDIFVSYSFSGEWQTVWTTLVVRLWYSNEFEHRELWRNAAEFAFSGRTLGLKIDNQQGEGTGTISLYFDREVPDELKAIFIEYAHRHLAKYACEVTRDRRYVCRGCGRPFKDLDLIRELLAENQATIVCQKCRTEVELIDFIEQRLKSDPVARKILAMEETATRELDTQALEQILIGHMMAIAGEANQIFRPVTMFDFGIDGEVEFKDNDGRASGKRIYIQLKSGNSYLRTRKSDGREVFDVTNERHLEYWISQPVDVYLVIRQQDEMSSEGTIRWMNVTRHLKNRKDKLSCQIIFEGHKLDMNAVWKVRDEFFPPTRERARSC